MDYQSLQLVVTRWESAAIFLAVLSAILTSAAALLTYLTYYWNRRRRLALSTGIEVFKTLDARSSAFEKASQVISLIAATSTLAGVLVSVEYTVKNRELQHIQDLDRIALLGQVREAAIQAAAAMKQDDATAAELEATYDQLADARARLQKVEKEEAPRTINAEQRKRMTEILTRYAKQDVPPLTQRSVGINPLAGDPETHDFAVQLKTVFAQAGWLTGFTEIIELGETEQARPAEGLLLELRAADDDPALRDALISAFRIVSPVVNVDYNLTRSKSGVWVVVGKKPIPPK
jgi:hypothetical protein